MAVDAAASAKETAADVAYIANQVGTELLANGKERIRIVELESQVNAALKELGKMLYATHTGAPSDSEIMLAKLQEIDALKAEIAALEEKLGRKPESRTCETCGAAVREDAVFCEECGEKQ